MNPPTADDRFTFPYGRYRTGDDCWLDCRREVVEPLLDPARTVRIVDVERLGEHLWAPGTRPRPIGTCRVLAGEVGLVAADVALAPGAKLVGELAPVFTVASAGPGARPTGLLEVFFTPARLRPLPESP